MHPLGTYPLTVLAIGAIGFGLWLLVRGGTWTVDAAIRIAERSGLSRLFIGATIVAFGTSAPELFTSVNANLHGHAGIALGNVVGSNVANILVVLGLAAAVSPVLVSRREVRADVWMMVAATVVLVLGMIHGAFDRLAGLGMVLLLAGFVAWRFRTHRAAAEDWDPDPGHAAPRATLLMLLGGLAALVAGSELLVQGAVAGGDALGVPEAVIGMTVVALGTSLPELTTSLVMARRGQSAMVVGNIVGSNTFNVLSIIGITALVAPLPVDPAFLGIDLLAVVLVTLLLALVLLSSGRIGRVAGTAAVLAYLAFVASQYLGLDIAPLTGATLAAPQPP